MTKSRIFLFLLMSFILGVFVRSFFEIDRSFLFLVSIFSLIALFIFYKNKHVSVIVSILLFFVIGGWRTDHILQQVNNATFDGKIFVGNAVVIKKSDSNFGQNLIIEMEKTKVTMLLQAAQYPQYSYGDLLKVICTAKVIENPSADEAGKDSEFDYRMYMAKEGVLYSCEDKKFEKVGENKGNIFLSSIVRVKSHFEENIRKVIPQPEEALAGGILFGGSSGLSEETKNDFARTGMTHIVAVSGYNVTIIAEYLIMLGIALGLWRGQAVWFAVLGIALFVIMVGLPASAVRAGVMSSILLWAMKNGRLASSENAIIFAGAIMLFDNPLLLRWDIGFQLSFLATIGIVASTPLWEKSFIKKHKAFGISEIIVLSLSAQIFVLPIIAYNFHSTSLISLLANVLILPIVPLSMLLVFLVSVSAFVFAPLAMMFAWLSYLPLHYELSVIHALAGLKWASVEIENMPVYFIAVYYIILVLLIVFIKNKFETTYNAES